MEDSNLKQFELSLKADDQIANLLNNVSSFGKISIERKSIDVDIEAYKQNQAQQRVVSIPVRSVHKDGSRDFNIDIGSEYSCDVTCIDNNTIAYP